MKLTFYSTLAQVLPVLLLVAVVEGRYFRELDSRESYDRFLLKGMLLMPILGESSTLICLACGHDNVLLRGVTLMALVVTGMLLFVYASAGPMDTRTLRSTAMLLTADEVQGGQRKERRPQVAGIFVLYECVRRSAT